MMVVRAISVWSILMLAAILNGFVRDTVITPRFGEPVGHVASTITLCAVILLVARLTIRWLGPRSSGEAWCLGLTWLLLTLAFEFLAGHYVFGQSWQRLLADYDLSRGRLWPLVLISTFVAPVVAVRLRGQVLGHPR